MLQMLPDMPMAAKFFVAFVIVLALIGLTAWLVRRFGANRLSGSSRGRQPRLAVIDAASVDSRRRLVLIRRDNVEHLMMIGGPNDLIIEPNIVRAAARDAGRDTLRAAQADALPRAVPNGEAAGNWPLQPAPEPPAPAPMSAPMQMPPPRSYRPPVADEPWVAPEPPAREPNLRARPADSLAGMAAEFKLSPDLDVPPPPRLAPQMAPPREPAAPPPALPPQTDHNLAEMAQRLEAALRRPSANDMHPPVTDPLAASVPPPPRPAPPPLREVRPEPKADFKPEPKFEPKSEPKPAQAKNPFDSLEEEMASLLGRQSGKT
jgi:flagellar protein FliO/FliZ